MLQSYELLLNCEGINSLAIMFHSIIFHLAEELIPYVIKILANNVIFSNSLIA